MIKIISNLPKKLSTIFLLLRRSFDEAKSRAKSPFKYFHDLLHVVTNKVFPLRQKGMFMTMHACET